MNPSKFGKIGKSSRSARQSHFKHPWMGLSLSSSNSRDVVKQLPDMVRPITQRAVGPRGAS